MTQDKPSSISASDHSAVATDHSVAVSGDQNVVITGGVGGDVNVSFGAQSSDEYSPPPLLYAPELPTEYFVGRDADLIHLEEILRRTHVAASIAICGIGGVGKTTLARKVVQTLTPQFSNRVLWINLDDGAGESDVLNPLALQLKLSTIEMTVREQANTIQTELRRLGRLLVVVDDIWDLRLGQWLLRKVLPPNRSVVITSRDILIGRALCDHVVFLQDLEKNQALTLLSALLGGLGVHEETARKIITQLGGLPLALDLAARQCFNGPDDLPWLLDQLKRSGLETLKIGGEYRDTSLRTCFALSYQRLAEDLQRCFRMLGAMRTDTARLEDLARLWDDDVASTEEYARQLARFGLLERTELTTTAQSSVYKRPYAKAYRMHSLLRTFAADLLETADTEKATATSRSLYLAEREYLDTLIAQYQFWAEKYTPLAGIAETRAVAAIGQRRELPMLFMPTGFEKLEEHGFGIERRTDRVPVEDLRDAVMHFKRFVLLGEPGSGKTTTLSRLAYESAVNAQVDSQAPLPLSVPLGGFTGPEPAFHYIQTYFGELGSELGGYLDSGRVILLLDGLNEMPQHGYRERVKRIQHLLDSYPKTPVIIACRTLDYVETMHVEKIEIKPLDPNRQRTYLHRYLGEAEGERLFWLMSGNDVQRLWQAWQQAGATWQQFWTNETIPDTVHSKTTMIQDELWKRLRNDWLPPLWALGRNPYMLVMLAQVFASMGGDLPQNRGRLFAAFVDTLLAREQKRYDPARWPGSERLCSAMAHLAWSMQVAGERGTAVDRAWAIARLAEVCEPTQALYLCASASLLDDSGSAVRYVHQLLQEYFVAVALQDRMVDGEDLGRYWPDGWIKPSGWEETFVLLAGILPDITPLVKQLLVTNPPMAARCIGESGGERPTEATVRMVQQRLIQMMIDPQVAIPQRNAAGVAINYLGDPRPGVGLRLDDLPDLEWVLVPDADPSGRREFVYGNNEPRTEPDFWITRYPVTYWQFQVFLDAPNGFHNDRWWQGLATPEGHRENVGEQRFKHWNHPRERVSWYDAIAFCRWLTTMAQERLDLLPVELDRSYDWKITLPTEWQWEKAARGHDGRKYPWGGEDYKSGYANIAEPRKEAGPHDLQKTSAVGIYPQGGSPYGIADLSGNIFEWCLNEYSNPERVQDEGEATRVGRGGSWFYNHDFAAAPFRVKLAPYARYHVLGFRVCAVIRQE